MKGDVKKRRDKGYKIKIMDEFNVNSFNSFSKFRMEKKNKNNKLISILTYSIPVLYIEIDIIVKNATLPSKICW